MKCMVGLRANGENSIHFIESIRSDGFSELLKKIDSESFLSSVMLWSLLSLSEFHW